MKVMGKRRDQAPEWIVSFTDMTSLEMAFFIMLMSFSTPRQEKLDELRGGLQSAFGFQGPLSQREGDIPSLPIIQGREWTAADAPRELPAERIRDHDPNGVVLRLKDQSGFAIDLDRLAAGERLHLTGVVAFLPGSHDISADSYPRLAKVAAAIRDLDIEVCIRIHGGRSDPTADPSGRLERDIGRAIAVARHLVDDDDILPRRVSIAAAQTAPRSSQAWGELVLSAPDASPRRTLP